MVVYREQKWRTLDDILNSISSDMRNYYSEGTIETAELIKIIHKCNYELGLQIHKTKETILEVEHFRTKLPADFHFLNFANVCYETYSVTPSFGNGLVSQEIVTPIPPLPGPVLSTCPCWTVVSLGAQTNVTHCDGTIESIDFPANTDGSAKTTTICATLISPKSGLSFTTDHMCWQDLDGTFDCSGPATTPCNTCAAPVINSCLAVDADPWKQNKVYAICNDTVQIEIVQENRFEVRRYRHIEPLYIQPSRDASAFSSYDAFKLHGNTAMLRDGFLQTGKECATVYINYQGIMEDDDGNLLVLDHPMINLWYESEIEHRILRNLYINGEPDIERRLAFLDKERKEHKFEAMRIAFTPDYRIFKQTMEIAREQEYTKHFKPFDRFYGQHWRSIQFDRFFNGQYRQ